MRRTGVLAVVWIAVASLAAACGAGPSVRPEVAVVRARPAMALVQASEEHDASIVVVGSYGESPLRSALLGSTPHKLLHLTTRPVLVVPQM